MEKINIEDYIVNNSYTRDEIMASFKVSGQGGMMRSHATNTLVLISNRTKLYKDHWHEGIMRYTGMGQIGDQDLNFAQNKTLLESNENGVTVHFFEILNDSKKRKYIYKGIVKLEGKPFIEKQLDANNNYRQVWIFPLRAESEEIFIEEITEIDSAASTIILDALEKEDIKIKDIILIETNRPEGNNKPTYKRRKIRGSKTDFLQKAKKDIAVGLRGEELVVHYEKANLEMLGLNELAKKVRWVSKESDDYGFDVLSYDKDGLEKFIEVKTTTIDKDTHPFDISSNEITTSYKYKNQYWIYRIYDVIGEEPKFFKSNGIITEQFELVPTSFKAYLK
jgi:hypothetical protein